MEQRRLRLGDILDDYCPRERRVTNHAVVAMIEENVKQTRCTTCDAEHAYKGAKVPRRRQKDTPSALYKDVLAGMPEVEGAPASGSAGHIVTPGDADIEMDQPEAIEGEAGMTAADGSTLDEQSHHDDSADEPILPVEDGPVHRPLIRATLPRIEGQKEARPVPDFTIRQPGAGRGSGNFRGGDPRARSRQGFGDNGANGNRAHGGQRFGTQRPAGPGPGQNRRGGPSAGFRGGQGQGQGQPRQGGGGRKRSR